MDLKNKRDRFNVFRALTAPFIFLFPFYMGFPEGYQILTTLLLWAMLNDINHVLHLHIHNSFSNNKYVNLWIDWSMGVVTGMVASNWLIQHKYGHHRLGQAPAEFNNKWDFAKPQEMDEFSIFGSTWYSIRTSAPIFLRPILESYRKGILQNLKTPVNYRYAFFEQIAFIGFVIAMMMVNPWVTLSYLIPWYCFVYFVTRYTDYLNHNARGHGKFDSSNNSLNKAYNNLGCNFGYHSAHHFRPFAHWSELPKIHEQIKHELSPDQIKTYSWSGFLIPYHFYLSVRGKF